MMEHHEHVIGEPIDITDKEMKEMEQALVVADISEASPEVLAEARSIEVEEVNLLSPLELQIAEEKLNNISPRDIARRLGISDKVVRIVLARNNVRRYIKDIFDSVTSADKEMRMQLMAAMIENKMEDEGINSKLDLAQLIQMLDGMGKVKEQADVGSQGSVMINILNQISKNDG